MAKRRRTAGATGGRRAELLERIVDYLLDHGLGRFSLRPAGHAAGTSARMLVHHFGSKDHLLTEALAVARVRQMAAIDRARAEPLSSFDEAFRASWAALASDTHRRFLHLSYELLALALRDRRRYRRVLETWSEEWRVPFAESLTKLGIDASTARDLSTVYTATLRGLLLDLAVTRDAARVNAAVERTIVRLRDDILALARPASAAREAPGKPPGTGR
jgi:AcrR family transcriptional regulator